MKYEVIYSSITGNTKKVARVIGMAVGTEAKKVKHGSTDADIIFLGSGCYGSKPAKAMRKFIETHDFRGKEVVIFGTYDGKTDAIEWMKSKLKEKGAEILDTWTCRGSFLFTNWGRPNDADLQDAREFAERIRKGISPKGKKDVTEKFK